MGINALDTKGNYKNRRLISSVINCSVWLYGILFLHWDFLEAHFLFMVDILMFITISGFKIIFSMYNGKNFFTDFIIRLFIAVFIGSISFGLLQFITPFLIFDLSTWNHFLFSPNRWIYSVMVLNYFGYFFHDFIYSGLYKRSNPIVEAIGDFISLFVIAFVVAFVINYVVFGYEIELLSAIGIVVGRFGSEIFIFNKKKTDFRNE